MMDIINMSRRGFLQTSAAAGGGLILGFCFPFADPSAVAAEPSGAFAPNAFIRIGRDGAVTFIINKSEMGQGVYTSLAMLLAEELECDWKRVRVEAAPVDPAYNHTQWGMQGTGGSTSVWSEWERLSRAGAAAREMLIAAAAKTWKVQPASCRAEKGRVIHKSGKSLEYGKLVDKAAGMPVPKEVSLKKPDTYRIVGKPMHRLDGLAKANGTAQFGLDVIIPGMLTAVIARPPVFGAKVKSFKTERAKALPGVMEVVQVPSGVAVVGTDFWAASEGRDALEIDWDEGEWGSLSSAGLREEYAKLAATPGAIARKGGDPEQALAKADRRLSAEYHVPYLAHATMEPLNATVDLRSDGCDIWTGTQFQTADRDAAARATGLRPEQVRVHTTYLGGGFGRRANPQSDFVMNAVEVAKEIKKPVKVVWTREDDMKGGYYRPMWFDRIAAGLDAGGRLMAWRHTIVGQSILAGTPFESMMVKEGIDAVSVEGAENLPYAVPNILVDLHSPKVGVPVLWWRSVGHSHTAFVVESFLDEIAHAAGKDPFEFRRILLTDKPRHRGVLELAAQKAGWGKPLPAGRSRGIAVHESFGSFVAQVAEVSVNPKGRVQVHRVVCAIDCGRFVNPDIIAAQMESGIAFGLSAALHGAITLKNGRVEQENFDDYPLLRMHEMPRVEVHIAPSREAPGGVGEPGVPPIAPAVANAVFAASGARLRSLPMTPDAVQKAMKG
ncbi:MAG: xanthine dehydrogenase family protein molybdopterin-binding subunit [Thermodesulfobacteriota bacterium]